MARNYNHTEIYYVPFKRDEFFEGQAYKNFKKIVRSKNSSTAMINYMDLIYVSMQDRGLIKLEPELYDDIYQHVAALLERPDDEVRLDLIMMKSAGLIQVTKNNLLVIICEDVASKTIGAINRSNQRANATNNKKAEIPTKDDQPLTQTDDNDIPF